MHQPIDQTCALFLQQQIGEPIGTQEQLRYALDSLCDWLHGVGLFDFCQVTPALLQQWLNREERRGQPDKVLSQFLLTLRSLCHFLVEQKLISTDLSATLSLHHLIALSDTPNFCAQQHSDSSSALQERAQQTLFNQTGLNELELIRLNWGDLSLREGVLRLSAHDDKIRLIPIGEQAATALQGWLTAYPGNAQEASAPVFVNPQGKRWNARELRQQLVHSTPFVRSPTLSPPKQSESS